MGHAAIKWRDIPGYEGRYAAGSDGSIKSLTRKVNAPRCGGYRTVRERILCAKTTRDGYMSVDLSREGASRSRRVHILVALAFHGEPPGQIGKKSTCFQVNHKDGNKLNNSPENLEWVTPSQNKRHAVKNGLVARGESHGNSRLTSDDVRIIKKLLRGSRLTHKKIAEQFDIDPSTVSDISRGKSWRHIHLISQ